MSDKPSFVTRMLYRTSDPKSIEQQKELNAEQMERISQSLSKVGQSISEADTSVKYSYTLAEDGTYKSLDFPTTPGGSFSGQNSSSILTYAGIAGVTALSAGALTYSPPADASLASSLTSGITTALKPLLEQMTSAFGMDFSSVIEQGNKEQTAANAKGFDALNTVFQSIRDQRTSAESLPDPGYCEAEIRAEEGVKATNASEMKSASLQSESINSKPLTKTTRKEIIEQVNELNLVRFFRDRRPDESVFAVSGPLSLKGRRYDAAYKGDSTPVSSPAIESHTQESSKRATETVDLIFATNKLNAPVIDESKLRRNDGVEKINALENAQIAARISICQAPFHEEIADRTTSPERGGKSVRELMHEHVHDTYYSNEYNTVLTGMAAPTPVLAAIAKQLAFGNMMAVQSYEKLQTQNQVLSTLASEVADRNAILANGQDVFASIRSELGSEDRLA